MEAALASQTLSCLVNVQHGLATSQGIPLGQSYDLPHLFLLSQGSLTLCLENHLSLSLSLSLSHVGG
jgi:hypothetical protein